MSRFTILRSRGWNVPGCLAVALALALAPAVPRADEVTPYFARDAADKAVGRPGDAAEQALKQSLTTPSPENRWGNLPLFGRELFAPLVSPPVPATGTAPGTAPGAAPGTAPGAAPVLGTPVPDAFQPPETGTVSPDYVLGPGDQLTVFVSAFVDTSYALTLDREGKVFLPHVGSTYLWGLSFADAEQLIRGRIGSVLKNARLQVSMGRMRTIDVFVLGAVQLPGKRTLSGLATAFHALIAAGGPTALGSLRDVRVLRQNHEVGRFDLYPFLLQGDRSHDVRLESGDVVFVGPALARVGIQGAVTRPAVYEMAEPRSLRSLLAMAGGPTPFADLNRIQVERVDANGGFRIQDLPLDHGHGVDPDSLMFSDYDLVTVLPLTERVRNFVTLDGYVHHPGSYELTPGMKLSQLLTRARLLPEAALDRAELRRVNPATFAIELHPFVPEDLLEGRTDMELQPLDAITVFSTARLPRAVTLDGEVMRPGTYPIVPGERLSSVLARAGGVTSIGSLRSAVLTRPSAAAKERETEHEFLLRQQIEIARDQVDAASQGDSVNANQLSQAQNALLTALERNSQPGRVVLALEGHGPWQNTSRDPELENGDRFFVPPRPTTVAVVGSVKNPGTLLARSHATSGQYLRESGGTAPGADLGRSYVLRANGEAVHYSSGLQVEPGDALVIAPKPPGGSSVGKVASGGMHWITEFAVAAALVMTAVRR